MKDTPCVGASGAIFGVLAAYAILFPFRRLVVFIGFGFLILPAYAIALIFAFIETLYVVVGAVDYVAHTAHLGGLIIGALMTIIIKKYMQRKEYMPIYATWYVTTEEEYEEYEYY